MFHWTENQWETKPLQCPVIDKLCLLCAPYGQDLQLKDVILFHIVFHLLTKPLNCVDRNRLSCMSFIFFTNIFFR